MYDYGLTFDDPNQRRRWLKMAAQEGNVRAVNLLCQEPDEPNDRVRWLSMTAEDRNVPSDAWPGVPECRRAAAMALEKRPKTTIRPPLPICARFRDFRRTRRRPNLEATSQPVTSPFADGGNLRKAKATGHTLESDIGTAAEDAELNGRKRTRLERIHPRKVVAANPKTLPG